MTEEADRMRKQPEEWLDVCDNQGNPTGERVLRSAAHRDGTPHRTAHVWLIRRRPAGGCDVLLQKRSREKDAFPGCYDISSAGHIPAGDGFVESALRELEEELGIRAEPSELVRIGLCDTRVDTEFHGCPFRNREISAVFVCEKPVQRSDFHLQREEVEEVCWIDMKSAGAGWLPERWFIVSRQKNSGAGRLCAEESPVAYGSDRSCAGRRLPLPRQRCSRRSGNRRLGAELLERDGRNGSTGFPGGHRPDAGEDGSLQMGAD